MNTKGSEKFFFKCRKGKRNNVDNIGIGGCILGIDMPNHVSHILEDHSCIEECCCDQSAVSFNQTITSLKNKHDFLVRKHCTPVYVFEGAGHPMKLLSSREGTETCHHRLDREKMIINDSKRMQNEHVQVTDMQEDFLTYAVQWMKENGILFFCAPFEATWQLVSLEKQGLIDHIVSEDNECLFLGAQKLITRLDFETGDCDLYIGDKIWQEDANGGGEWLQFLPELSSFLGNDYVCQIYGISLRSAKNKFLPEFIAAEDKDFYLDNIEKSHKWPKSFDPSFKVPAKGFKQTFKRASNLLRYAPVFKLAECNGKKIDLSNRKTFRVALLPINDFCEVQGKMCSAIQRRWGEQIGFSRRPSSLLRGVQNDNLKEAFCMDIWPRTGEPLPGYAKMAQNEIMNSTQVRVFTTDLVETSIFIGPKESIYSLNELFSCAAVYIGITRVSVDNEKFMFLTERGASVPVLRWRDGSCIKGSEADNDLDFFTKTVFTDSWQANVAQVEYNLHKRFDKKILGKQKLWRIPGMGGIKKRQTKKEGVIYKVFICYSFVVPRLIDLGEIKVTAT